jgi:hypothetical protein
MELSDTPRWRVSDMSCEPVARRQGREHGTRAICIVGSRYLATLSEDIEALIFAGMILTLHRLVTAL